MAGIQDLLHRYAYGGPVRRYAEGDVVDSTSIVQDPQFGTSTTAAPTPQPAFSSDKTLNDAWLALAGKSGNVNATGLTAQQKADAQAVFDARTDLANRNSVYQTNQNLANMYGITEAPAQNQFLTDFNTAVGFDPTTSANLMKGMSDATTMANMNKEIGNSNFHYTGEATAHPNLPYQLNPSEALIRELIAENTANPNKGSGNAIMNQFLGDSKTVGNPFLGEYKWGATPGIPVRKDTLGNPLYGIVSYTNKELTDLRNGPIPTYTTAAQSKNNVGDIFILKDPVLSQENDASGYMHIVSGGKEYTIEPKSKRIISITPITHDGGLMPYGQGPNPYGGALTLAKGGSVQMPQEYSRGNWKLI